MSAPGDAPTPDEEPQDGEGHTPTRLARRLGLGDAVVVGLGAMLGAGVFAAIGPAAAVAGSGLLLGLAVAAAVAYCNATSSAQLAALYPEAGGTYVHGRRRLGAVWGYLAGWGFVVGKLASCAALALTFGAHVAPAAARLAAVGAVVTLTAVNLLGVSKTVAATRLIVGAVLATLAVVVVATLAGGTADVANLSPAAASGGAAGILEAGGLLFFAFAGYARIATLGEEVMEPARTIPRAIPLALGITLAIYALVAAAALMAAGPDTLAESGAPLAAAVTASGAAWLAPLVRAGAAVAMLGVLLSLLAGVSRTMFAMASAHDLPHALAAVDARRRIPQRAEIAAAVVVIAIVARADVRGAIGFSAFTVLAYYAIANAAALTLRPAERRWPRSLAVAGIGGCALLAFSLPPATVLAGAGVLAAGLVAYLLTRRREA